MNGNQLFVWITLRRWSGVVRTDFESVHSGRVIADFNANRVHLADPYAKRNACARRRFTNVQTRDKQIIIIIAQLRRAFWLIIPHRASAERTRHWRNYYAVKCRQFNRQNVSYARVRGGLVVKTDLHGFHFHIT